MRRTTCPKAWADRYKGKFDQGWDKLREETFARQKAARRRSPPTPSSRPATRRSRPGTRVPADLKKLYARQMEVYAGFQENADYEIGRVVRPIDDLGLADNTLVLYIWGDNGSSMEGTETGSFNEMTTLNGIPLTAEQQLKLDRGVRRASTPGAGRACSRTSPAPGPGPATRRSSGASRSPRTSAARANPMVVSWPERIKDRGGLRTQFTHVIDVAPTILEAAGIAARRSGCDGIHLPPDGRTYFAALITAALGF